MMARAMAVGVSAAVAACGGGGGGGGGGFPLSGNLDGGVDPGDDGTDNGESTFTADQRSAITRRAHDQYKALLAAQVPTPMQALSDWMRTQPEYTETGASADSAWARFTDGRYFLYTDSWPRIDLSKDGPIEHELRAGDLATRTGLVASKKEIPSSNLAVIMSADDGDSFDAVKGMQQNVADMLKEQGWRIHGDRRFTVEAMVALGQVEMGIFYLAAHGGFFGPSNQKEYCFITETRATDANEAKFRQDFRTGRLIYHRDRNREDEADGKLPPCLAVTAPFIQRHLHFSDGALVVTLCCHSGSPEGEGFRNAFASGRAITHVAWDGNGNDFGARSMEYMFDRLTGANKRDPGKPNNRAFDMDDVWDFMGRKSTRQIKPTLLVSPATEFFKPDAYIKRFGNGFDLSNPVISELAVDSDDKLIIYGNFGSEPGEVSIDGTKVSVDAWDNDKLELTLPTGKSDPAGSHGDITVTARKRTSNRRVLTSWRGTVEYTFETLPIPGSSGLLTSKITVDLHVRGDAHERRTRVDGPLMRSLLSCVPASDTDASYRNTGTNSGGLITTTWSGSGPLPFSGFGSQGNSLSMNATVDSIAGLLKISPVVVGQDLLIITSSSTGGGSKDSKSFLPFHTSALGFTEAFGGDSVSNGTAFQLDGTGNVLPYEKRIASPDFPANTAWMRVKTSGMTATPSFDDTVGR